MSTIGLSPVTVMVSSTLPTFNSASTVEVKLIETSRASRLTVLKPGSEKDTE